MNTQKKCIAQLGLGYWGKNILRNLYELGVIHMACDSSQEIINDRRKAFPDIIYTLSIEEVLDSSDIKAVVISAPAATHYDLVKK